MHDDYYRDLVVRAVADKDPETLNSIARQLRASTEALSVLRAKGYGSQGMMIDAGERSGAGG